MSVGSANPPDQPSLPQRILTHWVVRLLLTGLAFVLLMIVLGLILTQLPIVLSPLAFQELIGTLAALGAIGLVTVLVERRPLRAVGLGWRGMPGQWLRGAAVGAGLMSACVLLLALAGGYRVGGLRLALGPLLSSLLLQVGVGLFEEGLFRGMIFRLLEEGLGSWVALVLSSTLFGAIHLLNPQATPLGAAAIAVEAGVLLAAAYMLTRSLWFVAGLHTAWNFFQGSIFGSNISGSGIQTTSLLVARFEGPELLTGGVFGIEASLIAILLGLALGLWFAVRAARSGRTMRALLWRGGINRVKG
ncbi:MAG: CPBP family intramembrane metalloprotease [Oscillochloris sp.]|nr:CPBP family intramembrane metalloprotease [Oscillochloris sp.]